MLVITETALASILLIGAGLAIKGLWSLRSVELGFVSKNVLTFRIAAPAQLTGQRIARVLPSGCRTNSSCAWSAIGSGSSRLADERHGSFDAHCCGREKSGPRTGGDRYPLRAVGEDYFHTLQIPMLQGRAFNERDTASTPAVAIVSESLARKYWPGDNPIGKRLKPISKVAHGALSWELSGDIRHWGADVDIEPTAYYPYTQIPDTIRPLLEANMAIAIRAPLARAIFSIRFAPQ